ncbi:hypothetical protein M5689_011259 [Euphorbia peplus]|nr:hypothetical protein M5689_011259 [Euphorbia peplus]
MPARTETYVIEPREPSLLIPTIEEIDSSNQPQRSIISSSGSDYTKIPTQNTCRASPEPNPPSLYTDPKETDSHA